MLSILGNRQHLSIHEPSFVTECKGNQLQLIGYVNSLVCTFISDARNRPSFRGDGKSYYLNVLQNIWLYPMQLLLQQYSFIVR